MSSIINDIKDAAHDMGDKARDVAQDARDTVNHESGKMEGRLEQAKADAEDDDDDEIVTGNDSVL